VAGVAHRNRQAEDDFEEGVVMGSPLAYVREVDETLEAAYSSVEVDGLVTFLGAGC